MGTEEVCIKDILFALRDEYIKIEQLLDDLLLHFEFYKDFDECDLSLKREDNVVKLYIHLRERQNIIKRNIARLGLMKKPNDIDIALVSSDSDKVLVASEYYAIHNGIGFGMKASSLLNCEFTRMFSSIFSAVNYEYTTVFDNKLNGMTLDVSKNGDYNSTFKYLPTRDVFLFKPGDGISTKEEILAMLYSKVPINGLSDEYKKIITTSMAMAKDLVIENGDYSSGVTEFTVEDYRRAYVLKKTL